MTTSSSPRALCRRLRKPLIRLVLGISLSISIAWALGAETVRIMPLGDSITRGGGSTGEVGYRRPLYLMLEQAGYQVDFVGSMIHGSPADFDVEHEGHGGYRADQLRDTITWWLDENPADIILLHIGINDIAGNNEDPQEVYDLLDSIDVWEAANHPVAVVIASRIVLRWDGNDQKTIAFNDSVAALVQQRISDGDNLIAVDMQNALVYPDDLRDGVHPNDVGYQKMANVWFNALGPLLPEPDTLAPLVNVENVLVSASSPENAPNDTLRCEYDLAGFATTAAACWLRNEQPLPTLYMPFEGGTDYALDDLASGTRQVAAYGEPLWDSLAGWSAFGAYVFDGIDDYIAADGGFPGSGSYTVQARLRIAAPDGRVIGGTETSGGHGLRVDAAGHLTAGHNGDWALVFDSTALPLDSWVMVTTTFDYQSGLLSLYRDGEPVDTATLSVPDREVTDTTIMIGSTAGADLFQGVIDEVRVYDFAMPAEAIALQFDSGHTWLSPTLTSSGETWRARVTPYSGRSRGNSVVSNGLTVGTPTPWTTDVALEASSPDNLVTDDLTCSYALSGSAVTAAVAWRRDNTPVMRLYVPMEGGAADATRNLSGLGGELLVFGDPVWDSTAGVDGHGCYCFDGNDFLKANQVFPTQHSYTKTAWVYRTGPGSSNIISGDVASGGHVFFASTSSQGGRLAAGHDGDFSIVRDPEVLSDSTWHFVAVAFDYESGEMVLYRNGVEVDRDTADGSRREVVDPHVYVAAFAASSQWVGYIDDARVYADALSPEQIHLLFNQEHHRLSAAQTAGGEVWQAEVTPFSNSVAGNTVTSNSLTIVPAELSAPTLTVPANESYVYTLKPVFEWTSSVSPFGHETIYYRLKVTPDEDFLFVATKDSLISPGFDWYDSLQIAQQYWWTVEAWVGLDSAIVQTNSDTLTFWTWTPGDVDANGAVNVADLTSLVNYLFGGGEPIDPPLLGDMNGSCDINVSDLTYLVAYLFQAGPAPAIGCQ
jgi:lysophospholipase L1-like esterase